MIALFQVASGIQLQFIDKRYPAMFERSLVFLSWTPNRVIMIGDRAETDIQGTSQLGFRTVGVRTGRFLPCQTYPKNLPRPDLEVESLADLDPAGSAALCI